MEIGQVLADERGVDVRDVVRCAGLVMPDCLKEPVGGCDGAEQGWLGNSVGVEEGERRALTLSLGQAAECAGSRRPGRRVASMTAGEGADARITSPPWCGGAVRRDRVSGEVSVPVLI